MFICDLISNFYRIKSSFNTDLSDVSHVFDVDGAAAVKVPGLQVALHVLCRWLEKLLLAVLLLALVPSMGMKVLYSDSRIL